MSQIKASTVTISRPKSVSSVKQTAVVGSPPPVIFFYGQFAEYHRPGVDRRSRGTLRRAVGNRAPSECAVAESNYTAGTHSIFSEYSCPIRNRLSIVLSLTLHGRTV